MFDIFKRSFRNEEQMSVEGVELWSVRWTSVDSKYTTEPAAEFFVSKQAAEDFAKALRDAFKLTRNALNYIEIQKESTPK